MHKGTLTQDIRVMGYIEDGYALDIPMKEMKTEGATKQV